MPGTNGLTPLLERLSETHLVHIDAPVFARHLLGDEPLATEMDRVLRAVRDGQVRAQTSALTLYQILAEVYRVGSADLARDIARSMQVHAGLGMVSASPEVAVQAAEVRAQLGGRPERAIQIATALLAGADIYLTTRSGLRRIAGMSVLNVEDYATEARASGPWISG